jgi:tetratricopeptide (TPR) repeat protein
MKKRNSYVQLRFVVPVLTAAMMGLSGCASGPGTAPEAKQDKAAAEKSHVYLDGVNYITLRESTDAVCAIPTGADKSAPATAAGPSHDWQALLAVAASCTKKGDWKTLEQVANLMARLDIDSPWAAYYLSLLAEKQGEYARAAWMADLAQKKAGGRNSLFMYQHARVMFAVKETAKAISEMQKAVAADSQFADGHVFLAQVYHRDLEFGKAEDHYRAALASDAGNYVALTGFAEMRLTQGGHAQDAADLYSKAIASHPSEMQAWIRLAFVYETVLKNNPLALQTYQGLKASLDSGATHGKPDFDLSQKIKQLETVLRAPAQASSQDPAKSRSMK